MSSAEVKKSRTIPVLPSHIFTVQCLVKNKGQPSHYHLYPENKASAVPVRFDNIFVFMRYSV